MAECPKCNEHLKLTDWKQNCPHCGANIVLYDLQERLMTEADKAEVQYYHFQKKIDRIKAAFIGSKLSIVRIFTSLLPIAALFLPIVKIKLNEPFAPFDGKLGALDIYNMFENLDLGVFSTLMSQDSTKVPAILFGISTVLLLLSLVIMLVHFVSLIGAYSKNGKKLVYTLDIIYLAFVVTAAVCFVVIPENDVISGSLHIGTFVYLLLVAVNFTVDILVYREKIEIKHAQCYVGGIPIEEYFEMLENNVPHDKIRAEMYERLTAMQLEKEAKLEEKAKQEEKANG